MFDNFKADLTRYFEGEISPRKLVYALFEMSLWAIGIFRFGKYAQGIRFKPLRAILLIVYFFLYKISEAISGIRISAEAEIGPGLLIHNFGGVVIRGRIGRNCTVIQGAQVISRADSRGRGWPELGDDVFLGAGSKVIGNVRVGNNVRIGANAVVTTDVPDDSVVAPPECSIRPRSRNKNASDQAPKANTGK